MAPTSEQSRTPRSKPERRDIPQRSRKSCPDCRKRKIKCDEKRPACTQCARSGLKCKIIDGLFRLHPFTASVGPSVSETSPKAQDPGPQIPKHQGDPAGAEVPASQIENQAWSEDVTAPESHSSPENLLRAQQNEIVPDRNFTQVAARHTDLDAGASYTPSPHSFNSYSPIVAPDPPTIPNSVFSYSSTVAAGSLETNRRDDIEVRFFFRHFAEGAGKWIDIFGNQGSYLSRNIVRLASESQLLRYSACALAAKQLGQMKDSTLVTNLTPQSRIAAARLLTPGLDFLWYGAKYYEKAILLMSQQISHTPSSNTHISPRDVYQQTGSDNYQLDEQGPSSLAFRILSASILCTYEDLSATIRACSGHIDGINKLLLPQDHGPVTIDDFYELPEPSRALDTSFWSFALNDVLNNLVLNQQCRLDPSDFPLWQRMGLPLDKNGQLAIQYIDQQNLQGVYLKALIRLLCKLINHDRGASSHWAHLDMEFSDWHRAFATDSCDSVTQLYPATREQTDELELPEIWFGTETSAIAMGFYHMARILLLVNQPREQFLAMQLSESRDLLSVCNNLQRDLAQHAMGIVAIANGMPNQTVQKYLIQPLYFAGRCVSGTDERKIILQLLESIENRLGIFTGYRMVDLSQEWGVPLGSMDES